MSAVLDFPVKPEARDFLACFAADPNEPGWLSERRRQGITRFAELGWPTRRNESWRYMDLSAAGKLRPAKRIEHPGNTDLGGRLQALLVAPKAHRLRLILVDGRFAANLSTV